MGNKIPTFYNNLTLTERKRVMEKHEKLRQLFYFYRVNGKIKNQKDFANFIGVDEGSVSKALQGNPSYLYNVIRKTNQAFPDANPDFLEGDSEIMMKADLCEVNEMQSEQVENIPAEEVPETSVSVIPRRVFNQPEVDIYEYANANTGSLPTLEVASILKDVEIAIHPSDDSMHPNIYANDYLLVRRVPKDALITDGKVYCFDTYSRGGFVRRFYQRGEGENAYFEGVADNSDIFPPAKIALSDINSISEVICILRKEIHSPSGFSQSKQIEQSNTHISRLITEVGKMGERADKADERTDRLIEMMMVQMKK